MRPCNIVFITRKQSLLLCAALLSQQKCGIDEGIPKHQLTFNYFADKKIQQ